MKKPIKSIMHFIVISFALWGLILTTVFMIEPYHRQSVREGAYMMWNRLFQDHSFDQALYANSPSISLETRIKAQERDILNSDDEETLLLDNGSMYKIHITQGSGALVFTPYSPHLDTLLSPSQYGLDDALMVSEGMCLYVGNVHYLWRDNPGYTTPGIQGYLDDHCLMLSMTFNNRSFSGLRYTHTLLDIESDYLTIEIDTLDEYIDHELE